MSSERFRKADEGGRTSQVHETCKKKHAERFRYLRREKLKGVESHKKKVSPAQGPERPA